MINPPIIDSAANVKLVFTSSFDTISKYESYGRTVLISKTKTVPIIKIIRDANKPYLINALGSLHILLKALRIF